MASVFIERGFDVVSGGTENHLFLLSLIKQDISGKDADAALGKAFITVNKNSVPNEDRKSTRLNSSHYQQSRMPSSA